MYNRYIPQPDGSYQRSRVQEPAREIPRNPQRPEESPVPQQPVSCANCSQNPLKRTPVPPNKRRPPQPQSIGSFFKQLLPGGFDTEDLLIVVLLLLMAGDCREDQNTALLTLVLYLFL